MYLYLSNILALVVLVENSVSIVNYVGRSKLAGIQIFKNNG